MSPLKARYQAPDGSESVSVIEKAAADIKPTFMQVRDASFPMWVRGRGLVYAAALIM